MRREGQGGGEKDKDRRKGLGGEEE